MLQVSRVPIRDCAQIRTENNFIRDLFVWRPWLAVAVGRAAVQKLNPWLIPSYRVPIFCPLLAKFVSGISFPTWAPPPPLKPPPDSERAIKRKKMRARISWPYNNRHQTNERTPPIRKGVLSSVRVLVLAPSVHKKGAERHLIIR